jgi:hypothetical protein
MKKLVLLSIMIFSLSCCEIVYDPEVFYVDEYFTLIDRTQKEMVVDGNTTNVRVWKIQRVIVEGDSIMVGEIKDNGCGCGIITDELWKQKQIGDRLYFKFINKERFAFAGKRIPVETPTSQIVSISESINLNNLEKERKILEIERQIMSLQLELNTLKELK